jgi:glutamate synthase (NADPH) large chain
MMNIKWQANIFKNFHLDERDACGIVACIQKENHPTKKNIDLVIQALTTMNHRAGFINSEGDGAGIHIDIPRKLWEEKLANKQIDPSLVHHQQFTVGHIFINRTPQLTALQSMIIAKLEENFEIVFHSTTETTSSALGPIATKEEPLFWQVALIPKQPIADLEQLLFDITIDLEQNHDIYVASLSSSHVVYKVMGVAEQLTKYFKDLSNPLIASSITLGHNRYSTNTKTNFFRVQPFSILGHNGEINTIEKLREEAKAVGVPLTIGGSDSQDLNRTLETFIKRHHFSLFEALDILFPPIINEIQKYPEHLQDMYTYFREAWGHYAQGPAGIISRYENEIAFSLDALGLRPLWQLETVDAFLFSSEPGILPNSVYAEDPKPLAPGEKVGLTYDENGFIKVYQHHEYQQLVYERVVRRFNFNQFHRRLFPKVNIKANPSPTFQNVHNGCYAAFGWEKEQIQLIQHMADTGTEPIRSLGHDAPLAALQQQRKNIADYLKESVAVVTNPAIDRDRETEHFSTRVILGRRPSLFKRERQPLTVELLSPILLEGIHAKTLIETENQPTYEQIYQLFEEENKAIEVSITCYDHEHMKAAIQRIGLEVEAAIQSGKELIVLNDAASHSDDHLWIDPHLVVSYVDQYLLKKDLRRKASLVLRSGAIRSLHDLITVFGLGADAVNPYIMFATVYNGDSDPCQNLFQALNKGLEKVISTIGIHELRGYGRLFSSIGLYEEFASILNIVNFFGADHLSFNWEALKEDARKRREDYKNEKAKLARNYHVLPRIWKTIGDIARGCAYDPMREKLEEIERNDPISIRHLTGLKTGNQKVDPGDVDISVGNHSLPFIISSMSFGSQNETAFRAYAEAADRLNMISFNGEGGEIKDMLGKYPNTRGQQIASGRFGVNAELLNSTNLLEIKIGQGAKPGEGGHLPGSKVTEKIAEARNTIKGSDLISPSNNHDIYSIEDLAQMISELKTANDQAKVNVKVPIVPNIGTIAVGIAKAGADFITLSGFDGGTGAARVHALQHVGLPAEIGVKAAHNALMEAGLRHKVELWCDGGVRSSLDTIKLMLLGANRVGFGTLSMIAVGCTACRGCHLDTCHVGIATQIETESQAIEHGLRRFVPRQFDQAVEGLMNMFTAFGNELKRLTAQLGFTKTQDIVGRSDLLEQVNGHDWMDLTPLLEILEITEMDAYRKQEEKIEERLAMAAGAEYLDKDEQMLLKSREYSSVTSEQRNLASRVSCIRVRGRLDGSYRKLHPTKLMYTDGSIVGNGFAAYISEGIHTKVIGGAQDGVAKTAYGGLVAITKSRGANGKFINGSVGKGFGYGAQRGTLIVQGYADSRAGIRLSGADMIIGQLLKKPISAFHKGNIGTTSSIKGFAFEYMTNGRGLVLGDPGPWAFAGMTGGVVYLRHQPEMGLTKEVLASRIAKGAKVKLENLNEQGVKDVQELLTKYLEVLKETGQDEEVLELEKLFSNLEENFIQVVPEKIQANPSVSTE